MILLPNFTFRVTFHFVSFRIHKRKKKTLFFFYLTLVLLTISYYNSKLNSTNIKKKTVKFFLLVFQICNSHSQQLIIINIHNLELIFITSIAYFFVSRIFRSTANRHSSLCKRTTQARIQKGKPPPSKSPVEHTEKGPQP